MIEISIDTITDCFIEIFSVNSKWRPDSPGVRITDNKGNRISVVYERTQSENVKLALILLYLWQKHNIKLDKKDELGYNFWGLTYDAAPRR